MVSKLKTTMLAESAKLLEPIEEIIIPNTPQSAFDLLQKKYHGPSLAPRRKGPQIKDQKL